MSNAEKIPIRSVVFDYGNVLCFPQEASDVEKMASISGIPVERFTHLYWLFRLPYDRGDLNRDTYWAKVAHEGGRAFTPQQVEQLVDVDCKGWARINHASMQWVELLRRSGRQLALLSNMPADISHYLTANFEWPSLFDHLIFSCDVGLVKPDPEIYHLCLQKLQAQPADVLFLDDRPENIEAAAKLGIHAVLFDTLENTIDRVRKRFEVPLPDLEKVSLPAPATARP